MSKSKIKVLYIAGFERSGSTLVNRVLGQIDGFVAWGELRDIWEHGEIENRSCTCGANFRDCDTWSEILDNEFYQTCGVDAHTMLRLKKLARASVLLSSFGSIGQSVMKRISVRYLNGLSHFYQSIQAVTGSKVIVDSTKASWYGYMLSQLPNIDLYTVHIVRDPRGVCHSLQRRKQAGEPECQWYNPLHASLSWNVKNFGVERLLNVGSGRYLRVNYEDFVREPESNVKSMLSLIGEPNVSLPFTGKSTVEMGLDHIVSGSPSSRFSSGEVTLRLSESWEKEVSRAHKSLIMNVTSPLRFKYGYPQ